MKGRVVGIRYLSTHFYNCGLDRNEKNGARTYPKLTHFKYLTTNLLFTTFERNPNFLPFGSVSAQRRRYPYLPLSCSFEDSPLGSVSGKMNSSGADWSWYDDEIWSFSRLRQLPRLYSRNDDEVGKNGLRLYQQKNLPPQQPLITPSFLQLSYINAKEGGDKVSPVIC